MALEEVEVRNKPKWYSFLLVGLALLLTSSVVGCSAPPLHGEQVIDALDTDKLLDIGYKQADKIVTVEGVIVRTYYATGSKGQPTFLNFHDPYEGYFTAVIWGDDRGKFPANPESYYLYKKVKIKGKIEIYKGDPEIILRQPSQIWVVE
jgi:micrococcal nuclease